MMENLKSSDIMETAPLISLFNELFKAEYNTILDHSADEPWYQPASKDCPHNQILFAHGFYASALHEIGHWLIAGRARWSQVDLGYWYKPDGRTSEEQKQFGECESRNQGLEWLLAIAAGMNFNISQDNLSGNNDDAADISKRFAAQVRVRAAEFLTAGLNKRSQILVDSLIVHYKTRDLFDSETQKILSGELLPNH